MVKSHCRVFRANLDDVENLSYGKGAKKQRGTGSRYKCHRLNRDERRLYDVAKRDGYLTVKGSGYRKERKGSPVWNTHRQRCDALEELCVVIEKRSDTDRIVIDFSTLRVPDDSSLVAFILEKVFQPKHPEFYDALIDRKLGKNNDDEHKDSGDTSPSVENTTHRTIDWEAVTTRPIWGVDERLIAVTCERHVAKSIATDVLRETRSSLFSFFLADADKDVDNIAVAVDEETTTIIQPNLGGLLEVERGTSSTGGVNYDHGETERLETVAATFEDQKNSIGSDDIDCIDW
eukprot:CAMPEP_0168300080 /NCGR_PEP_ID=MMETSP0142_2-20121227/29416_1 /TAXON_ID=44445 /ORGANISM="Pseudo-nitzschia australis, Strain 10249 10 AB" /LENGTH=289 /DNA_ID=CAMNT_0008249955 /DNA_START=116 /DNA_END=982 /DNA_ORIENTATION=-